MLSQSEGVEWIQTIDEMIKAFPPRVLSQVIVDYLSNCPFQFDRNRVFIGTSLVVPPCNDHDDYITITDTQVSYKKYSEPWIFVLSKWPLSLLQDSWQFTIEGKIFDKIFIGVCMLEANGCEWLCRLCLRKDFYALRLVCCIKKVGTIVNVECYEEFVDTRYKHQKSSQLVYTDSTDIHFFVTTGYENQKISVCPIKYLIYPFVQQG
jgi:hypothetical protein